MIAQSQVRETVLREQLVPKDALTRAAAEAQASNRDLAELLIEKKLVTERLLYEALARALRLPFADLEQTTIRRDLLTLIPEPLVQVHHVVAFAKTAREIGIATLEPDDLQTFEFLERKLGRPVKVHLTTPSGIRAALKQYHVGLKAAIDTLAQDEARAGQERPEALKKLAEDVPVVRIVDTLLEYAAFEGASDIHVEPTERESIVRYRVDGLLREVMSLPKRTHPGLIARIKILSNLKLDEHRLPQDGRFKVAIGEQRIALRVSILPVVDGEKVVLRILNESAQALTLESLGLQPSALELLKRNISKPHGIIYVTGPTGSGKTTTLYTIISALSTPRVNISTIEDPVEYRIPRVNQTQVSPRIGLTFANGLRALLRQDPNIIMVGEIRDEETAQIATNAALTGHLVLSTLHTNDAVTALPRLTEMNVPTFLITSTTNMVMAQRLVRKICSQCIESYTLTKQAIADLGKQIDLPTIVATLVQYEAIDAAQKTEELLFFRGRGCSRCNKEGYRGRIGIYEAFEMTRDLVDRIRDRSPLSRLRDTAIAQGMLTMVQDGFLKAKAGVTTLEEVIRVTRE